MPSKSGPSEQYTSAQLLVLVIVYFYYTGQFYVIRCFRVKYSFTLRISLSNLRNSLVIPLRQQFIGSSALANSSLDCPETAETGDQGGLVKQEEVASLVQSFPQLVQHLGCLKQVNNRNRTFTIRVPMFRNLIGAPWRDRTVMFKPAPLLISAILLAAGAIAGSCSRRTSYQCGRNAGGAPVCKTRDHRHRQPECC